MVTMRGFFSHTRYDFCVIHQFSLAGLSEMSKFQKSFAKASLISFKSATVNGRSGMGILTFARCNHVFRMRKDEMRPDHHQQTLLVLSAAISQV
jgi:hypothetical protein